MYYTKLAIIVEMQKQQQPIEDTLSEINSVIKKLEVELKDDKPKQDTILETPSFKNYPFLNRQQKPNVQYNTLPTQYQHYYQQPLSNNYMTMNQPPSYIINQHSNNVNTQPFHIMNNNGPQHVNSGISSVIQYSNNLPVRMSPQNPFDSALRRSASNSIPETKTVTINKPSRQQQILERLSALEQKISLYESKESEYQSIQRNLETRVQQLSHTLQQHQTQIVELKSQNQNLHHELKVSKQVQNLYEDELKQYKVKMVGLQKGFSNLKQQLGASSNTAMTALEKKKIEVMARVSRSPDNTLSKISSANKNYRK